MSEIKTPEQLVEENFKGLSDFIKDKDILHWFKNLIIVCIEDYHSQSLPDSNVEDKIQKAISWCDEGLSKKDDYFNADCQAGWWTALKEIKNYLISLQSLPVENTGVKEICDWIKKQGGGNWYYTVEETAYLIQQFIRHLT